MGSFHLNSGQIQSYDAVLVNEHRNGIECTDLIVTINTDREVTKFRIGSDERQPDINLIKKAFEAGLSNALSSETSNFQINEYSERSYIFVKFPDGTTVQYTANRIT